MLLLAVALLLVSTMLHSTATVFSLLFPSFRPLFLFSSSCFRLPLSTTNTFVTCHTSTYSHTDLPLRSCQISMRLILFSQTDDTARSNWKTKSFSKGEQKRRIAAKTRTTKTTRQRRWEPRTAVPTTKTTAANLPSRGRYSKRFRMVLKPRIPSTFFRSKSRYISLVIPS